MSEIDARARSAGADDGERGRLETRTVVDRSQGRVGRRGGSGGSSPRPYVVLVVAGFLVY